MISQYRRPSDSGRVNTAILGGPPAAMNDCKNLSSISAEGVEAMIPSPKLRQYQLSIRFDSLSIRANGFHIISKPILFFYITLWQYLSSIIEKRLSMRPETDANLILIS